jgi:MFS family permease
MTTLPAASARRVHPALVVILAGVAAALHVGKLPPAITVLQQTLGLTLVQAGFLLSLVQGAGMLAGVAFGAVADGLGLKRSMLLGLLVLAGASALGGMAERVAVLMILRACEGFGFLLVVLPAPGLVRRLVPPQRMSLMLGLWGAYMPLATALALLLGPLAIAAMGWRAWWWWLAGVALAAALCLQLAVPAMPAAAAQPVPGRARLRQTLGARGPWLVAVAFAAYSSQWLAVIGFLPVICAQAGLPAAAIGGLTALAAAVNVVGNIGSGRLLHGGASAVRLLSVGFVTMGLCAVAAFAGESGAGLPPLLRYGAVLVFSMVGGMIPATLFSLAVRVSPGEQAISTTVGWVQQWSAFGQFAGPPLVALVASRAGGWQWTWLVTGACALAGLALARAIGRLRPA